MKITKKDIEDLLVQIGQSQVNIIEISLTGSYLFFEEEERKSDIDIVIVCSGLSLDVWKTGIILDEQYYDLFFTNIEQYQRDLDFHPSSKKSIHNVFHPLNIKIYGGTNINWNLLDYKKEYISLLKLFLYNKGFNPYFKYAGIPYKSFVEPYLILKFIENNKVELNNEIINNVKKLYNNEGIEIIEWIGEKLNYILSDRALNAEYKKQNWLKNNLINKNK